MLALLITLSVAVCEERPEAYGYIAAGSAMCETARNLADRIESADCEELYHLLVETAVFAVTQPFMHNLDNKIEGLLFIWYLVGWNNQVDESLQDLVTTLRYMQEHCHLEVAGHVRA